MKAKYLLMGVVVATMTACNLDVFPTGSLTAGQMAENAAAPEYATTATYALLKDGDAYAKGTDAGNTYIRHWFQMAEFPGDNCVLSGRTEDVLYEATCYKNYPKQTNVQSFWYFSYHIISGANGVINTVKDGADSKTDQLKGENYFLRALAQINLLQLFAKPYTVDKTAPGIVIVTGTGEDASKRSTVEDCYNQVVADLENAIKLMNSSRGNNGYATKLAAQGLLSRVYLYMGEWQKCIDIVNAMGEPYLEQGEAYKTMFANAKNSREVLFCAALEADESKGKEMIASMFTTRGGGWGEIYASDPLLNLYERYPEDLRLSYIDPQYNGSSDLQASFPVKGTDKDDFRLTATALVKGTEGAYYFTYDNKKYEVATEKINGEGKPDDDGEYTQDYIMLDGEKQVIRINNVIEARQSYTSLKYFINKFSDQDGDPLLSSPVFIRWAEVILNRAEAYAHLNQPAKALADVNILRERAGIPTFSDVDMHGYTDILNVVLDERRMELAFEGFRPFDMFRNKLDLDRRFAGVQPWEVIKFAGGSYPDKVLYPIPYNEVTANSGVAQNPGYQVRSTKD